MWTIYSKPNCTACTNTYRSLNRNGIEYKIVDISEDSEALAYVISLGYQEAPVVVSPSGEHWSGFRPDRLVQHD